MEEEKKISFFLNQMSQPGFLVRENRIQTVNQAAAALLLAPGQEFSALIGTGRDEYTDFWQGQLCVTLTIGCMDRNAVIIRTEDMDLVILDTEHIPDSFRSLALVSMELRRPLMQAITAAQKQPADTKLNQSLMQMLRLVGNMSDIGRYAASSRMELRDVDAFLLELFEKAQTLTGSRARITFEGMKQPVFSPVDPEQLERAVWNILSNSLKFLPEDGIITARLTRKGNMLRLTVTDNGSGIPETIRSDLFGRYLRQPSIEDSRYGYGLGLAIVRTAAANHGGTVLIGSGKDVGTSVTMTLAIRQSEEPVLRSPLFRLDYTGGWDHGLVELSDCLDAELYSKI